MEGMVKKERGGQKNKHTYSLQLHTAGRQEKEEEEEEVFPNSLG